MHIGVIGAGHIGATVGGLWSRAGHQVRFAARDTNALDALVGRLGQNASAGSPAEAATFGSVTLFAVPAPAAAEVARTIREALAGKILIDATNHFAGGESAGDGGSSGQLAKLVPGVRVVKAFNTVNYRTLEAEAHNDADDPIAIPIAGDDAAALDLVETLVRDAGFGPVRAGDLASGRRFEPGSPLFNNGMRVREATRELHRGRATR